MRLPSGATMIWDWPFGEPTPRPVTDLSAYREQRRAWQQTSGEGSQTRDARAAEEPYGSNSSPELP